MSELNLLLDLLWSVVLAVIVVIKNGTCHHVNAVVNGGIFLQQGALKVLPDL